MEKFLPLGSVVLLKDSTKRLMITGFMQAMLEDDKIYDYCGCLFPEGMIDSAKAYLFNHDQIDYIYSYGLIDQEQKIFNDFLNKSVEEEFGNPNDYLDSTEVEIPKIVQKENIEIEVFDVK